MRVTNADIISAFADAPQHFMEDFGEQQAHQCSTIDRTAPAESARTGQPPRHCASARRARYHPTSPARARRSDSGTSGRTANRAQPPYATRSACHSAVRLPVTAQCIRSYTEHMRWGFRGPAAVALPPLLARRMRFLAGICPPNLPGARRLRKSCHIQETKQRAKRLRAQNRP